MVLRCLVVSLFPLFLMQVYCYSACPQTPISVFTSSRTKEESLRTFRELVEVCPCKLTRIQLPTEMISDQMSDSEVVVDLLESPFLSSFLSDWPNERLIDGNERVWPGRRQLYPPLEQELEALFALATALGVSRFCLFLPANAHFYQSALTSHPHLQVSVELFSEDTRVDLVLRQKVLTFGFTAFLVLLSAAQTDKILQALETTALLEQKIEIFASSRSAECFIEERQGHVRTGPVFLLPSGCEGADSAVDLLLCELKQALGSQGSAGFAVINMVLGMPTAIGTVQTHSVNLTAPVTYHHSAPEVYQTILYSFNNGVKATGDNGKTRQFLYSGADMAMQSIQQDGELLLYHTPRQVDLSLGYSSFDATWVQQQLSNYTRGDLGVAMFTSVYSSMAMGVYGVLDSMQWNIPQIGASNTAMALSSRARFPLFTRVVMSDAYLSVLYGHMIRHFGWGNVGMVYTNRTWETDLYGLLLKVTKSFNITIRNDENLRVLPENPSEELLKKVISALIACKVRILVLLLGELDLYRAIACLYDLGMRRGDVVFLAIEWMGPELFQQSDPEMKQKILELCSGAIQFYPIAKIGHIGQTFAEQYQTTYGQEAPFYACFYYDAAYLLAYALDYMLSKGLDYSQPWALNHVLKSTKFRGCSGLVSIDENSNDRSPMMYGIMNAQVSAEGKVSIVTVGTFNPAGLVLFNFTQPLMWPGNTTTVPTDLRISLIDCPFEETEIVDVPSATVVMCVAVCTVVGMAIMCVVFIWVKVWRESGPMQTVRAEISFDDYFLFATIGIEAVQYSAMGASKQTWKQFSYLAQLCSIQLQDLTDLRNGVFWLVLSTTFAVIMAWICLAAVLRFRVCKRVRCVERQLVSLADVLLPTMGDLCFVPVCSFLLSVFHCTQAAGRDAISSTFLQADCYQRCWETPHLIFMCFTVLFFWVYVCLAVALRPVWQDMKSCLHILSFPSYYMTKSIYQLLIIAIKALGPSLPLIAHSVLFTTVTSCFFVSTVVARPYSYPRANLWHSVSLLCVLWLEALSLSSTYIHGATASLWQGVWLLGVGLMCVLGLIGQWLWLPSLLYTRAGIHVVDLFRFMFSRGRRLLYLFRGVHDQAQATIKTIVVPSTAPLTDI